MNEDNKNKIIKEQIADNKRDQFIITCSIIGLFLLRIFNKLDGKWFVEGLSWGLLILVIGTVGKQVVNKDTITKVIKNFRK